MKWSTSKPLRLRSGEPFLSWRMARGWAGRCLLTGLHVCAGLAACGSLIAVLLEWAEDLNCLPPVTDGFGDPMPMKNALSRACDVIFYGSGVICGLSLLMALSLNCCWGEWCCSFLHQILTLLMCLLSAACGSALSVDFLLWCHSLQNTVSDYGGCESAAAAYDKIHKTSNMTAYYRKMEMQQVCQWASVPFLLCAVVAYSVVMRTDAIEPLQQERQPHVGGRYYILPDESAPLLVPDTPVQQMPVPVYTAGTPEPGGTGMIGRGEIARSPVPVSVGYSTNHGEGATNIITDRA